MKVVVFPAKRQLISLVNADLKQEKYSVAKWNTIHLNANLSVRRKDSAEIIYVTKPAVLTEILQSQLIILAISIALAC